MLNHLNIENILFLDIETVPQYRTYKDVPKGIKTLWEKKAILLTKIEEDNPEGLYERAGIYAEFGKVICISVGYILLSVKGEAEFRIKSFYGHDEKTVLQEFITMLNQHYSSNDKVLCAHNGKEFDFPYLARRILINGLSLPVHLDIAGKKPWEISHLDTMVLWKFGDFKSYTSLNLLATIFDIPTPKDDMAGEDVARVYWEDEELERIVTYCQKDVLAIGQLLLRFKGQKLIKEEHVVIL